MNRVSWLLLAWVLGAGLSSPADADDLAECRDRWIVQINQAKRTPGREDDLAVSEQMLHASGQSQLATAARCWLLDQVFDLAPQDVAGQQLAVRVVDQMQPLDAEQAQRLEEQLYRRWDLQMRRLSSDQRQALAPICLQRLLGQARKQADEDMEQTVDLLRRAERIARLAGDPELAGRLDDYVDGYSKKAQLIRQVEQSKRQILAGRRNSQTVGRLAMVLLLDMQDVAGAQQYAAYGNDEQLKQMLTLAGRPAEQVDATAGLQLARWYQSMANRAATPMGRAVAYLRAAQLADQYLTAKPDGPMAYQAKTIVQRCRIQASSLPDPTVDLLSLIPKPSNAPRVVDLLKLVKIDNAIGSRWLQTPEGAVQSAMGHGYLTMPAYPQGDYMIEAELTRLSDSNTFGLLCPISREKSLYVFVDGWGGSKDGFGMVDKAWQVGAEHARQVRLPANQKVLLAVMVRHEKDDRIKMVCLIDGRQVFGWQGTADQVQRYSPTLANASGKQLPIGRVGIGARSPFVIHRLTLKMLDGYVVLPDDQLSDSQRNQDQSLLALKYDQCTFDSQIMRQAGVLSAAQLTVGGVKPAAVLPAMPPSRSTAVVSYRLTEPYKQLTGQVAIADQGKSQLTAVQFRIIADGKTVWQSKPIGSAGSPVDFKVDLSGVREFKLQVDCPGSNQGAMAVWVDPKLTR